MNVYSLFCKQVEETLSWFVEDIRLLFWVVIMVLTQKSYRLEDTLKKYLTERGVTLSGGGSRKADFLTVDLLQLPTFHHRRKEVRKKLVEGFLN